MSLGDEIAKRKAQERADAARRANPEIEARLDQFIAKNPVLQERYNAISKEELVRELMLARMERAEVTVRRNRELEQWVNENPDIVAKVEQRVKNLAGENRHRAAVKIAKTEPVNRSIRAPRMRP
jgi:multidrug efflux pump subunit AcrA (membrane-fusion protein)